MSIKKDDIEERGEFETCKAEDRHSSASIDVLPKLASDSDFNNLADFFSVFSDATRLKIISALSERELCVCDLANILDMKQPSVSQHLKILWQGRALKKRKVGQQVFYRLDDIHIEKIYLNGYKHVKE